MQTANSLSITIALALLAAAPCFAAVSATRPMAPGAAASVTAFPAIGRAPDA